MIYLNKGTTSSIVVTLKEKTTLPTPIYLFSFVDDYRSLEKNCILDDISTNVDRYNKFIFTEATTDDGVNGQLNLTPGFWTYNIYEQTSTQSLVATASTGLVETGKVYVYGTQSVLNDIYL